MKKNGGALAGDLLVLTKPLGIGILSTAQKLGKLAEEHAKLSIDVMTRLNSVGQLLGKINGVHAMTDVTGFGLAGHLIEMCIASGTSAVIQHAALPLIDADLNRYISDGCVPGGTGRNYESYGKDLVLKDPSYKNLVCDPQTSGGILAAIDPEVYPEVSALLKAEGLYSEPIGQVITRENATVIVQ